MKKIITLLAAAFILTAVHTAVAANVQKPLYSEMKNSPNATRSEFCTLAYNLLNVRLGTEFTDETGMFVDTDKAEINTLASLGIINGRGNGIFDPDGLITREEAARILCSLMDYMGIEDREIVDEQFKDFDTVSDWAKEYVAKVGRNEIMEGNGDGYSISAVKDSVTIPYDTFHLYNSEFAPHSNYTVWQTKQTLYNLSGCLPDKTDYELIEECGGIAVYRNKEYVWAENSGALTISKPRISFKTKEIYDGRFVMGYDKGVYDLATGKRILKSNLPVYNLSAGHVEVKGEYSPGGVSVDKYFYYSYTGKLLKKSGSMVSYVVDNNGDKHYIFEDEDGEYLTDANGVEPILTGKYYIYGSDVPSNYFVACDYGAFRNNFYESIYQIYDYDLNIIYNGMSRPKIINSEYYALEDYYGNYNDFYRLSDGEKASYEEAYGK